METITVTITFTDAENGDVNVRILGANTDYGYDASASDVNHDRNFNLAPNVYSIKVHGVSGGSVKLVVKEGTTELVNASCNPEHIFILKSFAVN
ncbi:MAG: hypothetical protein JO080_14875 [Mucilaginibacter sp.]|nr:hypothetical protein [Mucilaginibacter sp.]